MGKRASPDRDARSRAADQRGTDPLAIRPRLLLVEDNPLNRLVLGQILDRLDIDHAAAGCAEEAVCRFSREAFDAVLLDVAMDGMAGLGAARTIRQLAKGDPVPIIALGTAGFKLDTLFAAGFDEAVETPVDADRLIAALMAALDRNSKPLPATG